jgi:hypothetical protein
MGASDDQSCVYEGAAKPENGIGGSVRCGYKIGAWMVEREKE